MAKKKKIYADKDAVYDRLSKKIEDAKNHTEAWQSNQKRFHKLRMRIKNPKTFPFVDCSNIRMPTGETKIRKLKASFMRQVFGVRPVVQVVPNPGGTLEKAQKIEKFLDHLIMQVIKVKNKAKIAVDQVLEKGIYLLQPYYRVEKTVRNEELTSEIITREILDALPDEILIPMILDELEADKSDRVAGYNEDSVAKAVAELRAGKKKVKVYLEDVIYDAPDVALVSPERCYVPTDTGFDVQTAECVCVEKFLPLRVVKANAKEGGKGWDAAAVNSIIASKDINLDDKRTDIEKSLREGIERLNNPSELVRIWEVQGWDDLNGDGIPEKVFYTLAPDFSKCLRKISLPWKSGKYNLVKLTYEAIDDRWFSSRGIIELIEDIIKEIDIQHMQKLDQQTIRNAPMFVYRAGMVNPNLVQFIPNQGIPVHGLNPLRDTIDVLNHSNTNVEFSYEKEEQILLGRIEELLGDLDFNNQTQINRREPKSGQAMGIQLQNSQVVLSFDGDHFAEGFSELFTWIFDLWCQYGPDEYEFNYFGQNSSKGETIKLSREEIQGYTVSIRGNDQNTNPSVKLQKAQAALQVQQDPIGHQLGVLNAQTYAAALKRYYQTLEIDNPEEFYAENPQPPQQPQGPDPKEILKTLSQMFPNMTDGEKAQVLQQLGVQPDLQGRFADRQQELVELESKMNRGGSNGKAASN